MVGREDVQLVDAAVALDNDSNVDENDFRLRCRVGDDRLGGRRQRIYSEVKSPNLTSRPIVLQDTLVSAPVAGAR